MHRDNVKKRWNTEYKRDGIQSIKRWNTEYKRDGIQSIKEMEYRV